MPRREMRCSRQAIPRAATPIVAVCDGGADVYAPVRVLIRLIVTEYIIC